MAILKTKCPKCKVGISSAKGFAVNQAICCPKCGTGFIVEKPTGAKEPAATAPKAARPLPVTSHQGDPKLAQAVPLSLDDDEVDQPAPKKAPGLIRYLIVGALVVLIGVVGYFFYVKKHKDGLDSAGANPHAEGTLGGDLGHPKVEPEPPAPPYLGPFPRRLLFIQITKYVYLNPLTNAQPGAPDHTRASALALAAHWKIPSDKEHDQVFLLSDTMPSPDGRSPTKDVIKGAYERFFDTSRSQDHIVVYFGGHAVEVNGKAYFAPIDGELDDVTTLIPVEECYAKLTACKATEKVVIWDVCRFNPQRGRLRPGSEPMSATIAKGLNTAPSDVEVMTTCLPGENAMEFFSSPSESPAGPTFSGSLFLEAFKLSGEKNAKGPRHPQPTHPIPVSEWATIITKHAAELAKLAPAGGTQTVNVVGKPRNNRVPFNPAEPGAKRFDIPDPPKKAAPVGPSPEVEAIVREFAVPPLKLFGLNAVVAEFPDHEGALKDYKADVSIDEILKNKEKYKFRVTVIDAFNEVRNLWKMSGKGSLRIRESFGSVTDALKKEIKNEQNAWAIGIANLEVLNERLDAQAKDRATQPKRWQAQYDYARAVIKSRLAYMNEYNLMLGNVLTETLPTLDKKHLEDGYKLVTTETGKMKSKKDIKQLAGDASELFEKISAERKGTPWGDQARRDKLVPLGLSWQPYSSKAPAP